jgi:hypothetical protein
MMREWVSNLLVLLGFATVVTLGSKSRRTHDFISLSYETPPTWRSRPPYLYAPGTGWPSYTSGHWVPSYYLQGYSGSILNTSDSRFEVEVEVNLQLTVSRPVCLDVGHPSGAHDQIFFFQSDNCGFLDVEHPV